MRIKHKWAFILLGVPVLLLATFFIVPFLNLVLSSLTSESGSWTLNRYIQFVTDAYYWETLLATFKLALWVSVITFLIGYPLAYFMTFVVRSRALRRLFYVIVVVPLFTSGIVRAFGWMVLLGRDGLINNILTGLGLIEQPLRILYTESSMIIGLSYIMTPFMVLTVASVLQNIDRSLHDAARDLGANPLTTFSKITFPLSLPGVIAGSLIVFTLSVSAYVTPAILSGGRHMVMSILIFQQYTSVFDFAFGATLAVVLLVTTLLLIVVYLSLADKKTRSA
jgi:putative spermidine/putrescine transport system permease protein